MSREFFKLSEPTDRTKDGPIIALTPPNLRVRFDYERDGGIIKWVELIFHDVLVCEYRQEACCTAEDLDAYNTLVKDMTSPWLSEMESRWKRFLGSQAQQEFPYYHWRLYFDDASCINIVAKTHEAAEMNSH